MKIACVAPDDLSTLIFCRTLSRMLAERGDVELSTISPVDMYRKELQGMVSSHIEIEMDRFISPLRDLSYLVRLYRIFRRGRYAAVITFTTKPNIYGPLAAWLAGVPRIVMAVRGLGRTFEDADTLKGRLLQGVVAVLYRMAAKVSDLVWFTNANDRQAFVDRDIVVTEKTFLTRNALDLSDYSMDNVSRDRLAALRAELGIGRGDLIVIMVARLIWSKGVREFCESAVALKNRFPNLRFLLVAPDEPPNANAVPPAYLRDMEGRSNLKWLGFRKDVRELYALCDMAALPSYYREGGYPRALLEPMAYGKPVIAADTEGCREPVEDGRNGYRVPPRDSAALAAAIEALAGDAARRRAFGEHSLARVQQLFDDRPVFAELIERVIGVA